MSVSSKTTDVEEARARTQRVIKATEEVVIDLRARQVELSALLDAILNDPGSLNDFDDEENQ